MHHTLQSYQKEKYIIVICLSVQHEFQLYVKNKYNLKYLTLHYLSRPAVDCIVPVPIPRKYDIKVEIIDTFRIRQFGKVWSQCAI